MTNRWHPLHQLRRRRLLRRAVGAFDREVQVRLPGVKHRVHLRLSRNASYILRRRTPEPEVAALMLAANHVFQPKVFWDVGANVGYYGWLLKSQNAELQVAMFEPDPVNLELLLKTLACTPAGVAVFGCAASDAVGEATFALDEVTGCTGAIDLGQELFVRREYGVIPNVIAVRTTTLDTIRKAWPPVDLLKIDVEGHEEAVLRGAEWILRNDQPIVIFESFSRTRSVLNWLSSLGYAIANAERLDGDIHAAANFLGLRPHHMSRIEELRAVWRAELCRPR